MAKQFWRKEWIPPATPEFQAWFLGSQVTNYAGKPKVVLHGCDGKVEIFCGQRVGSRHMDLEVGDVYYFSDCARTATWYAKSAGKQSKSGACIIPVYLSLKNPRIVDFGETGIEYLAEEIELAKKTGHDGMIARNYNDGICSTHFMVFRPELIKSAIGNCGAFSLTDPHICR